MKKTKLTLLLSFLLLFTMVGITTNEVSAVSNLADAPNDWAFDASSVELNDAIINAYPEIDTNNDGFISISEAEAYTGNIDLAQKSLTGTIHGIENFKSIIRLDLNNNQLTGEIPVGVGNLSNLISLGLCCNQFHGTIPTSIGNLSNLQSLLLYGNQLRGEIPDSLSNLSHLSQLYLSENQLTGEIPSSLGNLSNLSDLFLGSNQLTGNIPDSLGQLTKLTTLFLNDNKLSGEIPNSLSNLSNSYLILLNKNQFTSILPSTFNFLNSINHFEASGQTYTTNLTTIGTINTDYEFVGLPVYEELPSYGISFEYSLRLPDGTSKSITPVVSNGNLTVNATDLDQIGDYTLIASTDILANRFNASVYTTNFTIGGESLETITYSDARTNGIANKETSTKITIKLSKDIDSLSLDDIVLAPNTRTASTLNKGGLTSLGNGVYEFTINGTWSEGDIVHVTLAKTDYQFEPNTREITLHAEANANIGGPKDDASTINKSLMAAPQTGDTITHSTIMILFATTILSGAYLIIRKRKQ